MSTGVDECDALRNMGCVCDVCSCLSDFCMFYTQFKLNYSSIISLRFYSKEYYEQEIIFHFPY